MSDYKIGSKKDSESSANDDSSFDCDQCEQTFSSEHELIEHGKNTPQLL